MRAKYICRFCILGVLLAVAPARGQQGSQESVADAARRVRAEREKNPKAKIVVDNDNIPKTPGTISVVGSEPAPVNPPVTETEKTDNAAAEDQNAGVTDADLAAARDQLESAKTDLDLAQRTLALEQAQFYGKPGFASDKQGQAHVDQLSQDVEDKRHAEQAAEQKVKELEQKLHKEEAPGPAENSPINLSEL